VVTVYEKCLCELHTAVNGIHYEYEIRKRFSDIIVKFLCLLRCKDAYDTQ
jgi:hypothetical protein